MTIRRRLALSLLVVLLLFAANLVIYFWGNQRRESSVEALRRAVARQALISSLNQNLNDIQKQVTLLSQVAAETPSTGANPSEVSGFNDQLENLERDIANLRNLAEPDSRANIAAFAEAYETLDASWRVFYGNFGRNQTKAITELVIRAEPLAQNVIRERLPQLQKDESARGDTATENFYRVARLIDRTAVLIFVMSAVVAIGVAVVLSRQLTHGLNRLKEGAASIGSGNLDQRIDIQGGDELSDLAKSFNEMTGQLRNAQEQLVVQQKLASLGSLTAGIAHEIKNPLNFVTNFAEVSVGLLEELQDSIKDQTARLDSREFENIEGLFGDLQQNVAKIREHGKRADGIVRNMLMHSRGQSGGRQMTNLNSLVSEHVKLAYHGMRAQNPNFNVAIQEDLDSSLEPVSIAAQDLGRVFLNIANNACYAAYQKKKRLQDGFCPVVAAKTRDLGSSLEIRIRDNGDGVPEPIKRRIFEPFFTTKPAGSGTGLGLSMSHEIVQQHKGAIRVESEPGEYAEFIITLPKNEISTRSIQCLSKS